MTNVANLRKQLEESLGKSTPKPTPAPKPKILVSALKEKQDDELYKFCRSHSIKTDEANPASHNYSTDIRKTKETHYHGSNHDDHQSTTLSSESKLDDTYTNIEMPAEVESDASSNFIVSNSRKLLPPQCSSAIQSNMPPPLPPKHPTESSHGPSNESLSTKQRKHLIDHRNRDCNPSDFDISPGPSAESLPPDLPPRDDKEDYVCMQPGTNPSLQSISDSKDTYFVPKRFIDVESSDVFISVPVKSSNRIKSNSYDTSSEELTPGVLPNCSPKQSNKLLKKSQSARKIVSHSITDTPELPMRRRMTQPIVMAQVVQSDVYDLPDIPSEASTVPAESLQMSAPEQNIYESCEILPGVAAETSHKKNRPLPQPPNNQISNECDPPPLLPLINRKASTNVENSEIIRSELNQTYDLPEENLHTSEFVSQLPLLKSKDYKKSKTEKKADRESEARLPSCTQSKQKEIKKEKVYTKNITVPVIQSTGADEYDDLFVENADESENDSVESQVWYFDGDRQQASDFLEMKGENGGFVVRPGRYSSYALSVLCDGKIKNLKLRQVEEYKWAIGEEKVDEKLFSSLVELIDHQIEVGLPLNGISNLTQIKPVNKK